MSNHLRNAKGQFQKGTGFNDITGKKFGLLTPICIDRQEGKRTFWKCECECGNTCIRRIDTLTSSKNKDTISCGCLHKKISSDIIKKYHEDDEHHDSNTRFYKEYISAKSRCTSTKEPLRHYYLDKGIKFEWNSYIDFKNDMYESYCEHVKTYGEENTSIDRIDNDGNYCKNNCRWATNKVQCNNRSTNVIVLMNDNTTMTLKQFSESTKINYGTLRSRKRDRGYKGKKEIPEDILR